MTPRSRALAVIIVAGLAIFALSFVNGWIVHDREIRGEGYRHSEIILGAWRSVAMPVLTVGVLAALATAALALARRAGRSVPDWLLLAGSAVTLAAIVASFVPLGWDGHTTSVDLRPGVLSWVGAALAIAMVVAAATLVRSPRVLVATALGVLLLTGVAAAGRWGVLTAAGPSNQSWSDGTYVRTGGGGALELVIDDGTYRLAGRWTGAWEGSGGWTIALDDDPLCPDSRGSYHARPADAGSEALVFVKIVDTCEGGSRAEILESGTWEREP